MTTPRVYITDYIEHPDLEREVLEHELASRPSREIEVLLVWHEQVDRTLLERFPRLKAVIRYGVGYDNLDLAALAERGIIACNNPDYGVDEVADTALAMIMNATRGISRYDSQCRDYTETWQEHTLPYIARTSELRLGVVGAGRIGGSLLLKAKAIGFQTMLYDPYRPAGHEKTLRADRAEELAALLNQADIVSLNLPLNRETRNLVDREFIGAMKPGAALINTARGGLIEDLDLLYRPLREEEIGFVGLDVLPSEPPPRQGLLLEAWRRREAWLDGRLLINPHAAYFSRQAYREMRQKAALNALRVLQGRKPLNILTEDKP